MRTISHTDAEILRGMLMEIEGKWVGEYRDSLIC